MFSSISSGSSVSSQLDDPGSSDCGSFFGSHCILSLSACRSFRILRFGSVAYLCHSENSGLRYLPHSPTLLSFSFFSWIGSCLPLRTKQFEQGWLSQPAHLLPKCSHGAPKLCWIQFFGLPHYVEPIFWMESSLRFWRYNMYLRCCCNTSRSEVYQIKTWFFVVLLYFVGWISLYWGDTVKLLNVLILKMRSIQTRELIYLPDKSSISLLYCPI